MLFFTFEEERGVLGREGGHSKIGRENWGVMQKISLIFEKPPPPPPLPVDGPLDCPFVGRPLSSSVCPPVNLFVCLTVHVSVILSVCLSVNQCIGLSDCLPVCLLLVCLFVCQLFIYLFVCLPICQSV